MTKIIHTWESGVIKKVQGKKERIENRKKGESGDILRKLGRTERGDKIKSGSGTGNVCPQKEMAQAGELQESSSSDEESCVTSFGAMWRLRQWQ